MIDPSFKKLLHNGNFVKLWASQMLSQFSINIMNFYVLTRIYSLTQSTIAVSLMWVASSVPALIFGPFAGAVVDNFSRRRLLIITTLCQSVVVSLLIFPGHKVFFLYAIVFMYFLLDQLFYPSQQATAPHLVATEQLPVVNGLFLITQQASLIVGFGLGGILLTTIGKTPTILLAAFNLLVSSFFCFLLPKDKQHRTVIESGVAHFFTEFVDGYRFIKSHNRVLFPLLIIASTQIIIAIVSTSIPSFAEKVLHSNVYRATTFIVVPAALGVVATTLSLPSLLKKFTKTSLIRNGYLLAAVCLFSMFGLSLISHYQLHISFVISLLLGTAVTFVMVPAQSVLQSRTPDDMRGRVYGQLGFLLILATTVPLIGSAVIVDLLGPGAFMGLLGVLLLIGYLIMRRQHDLGNSPGV